MLFSYWAITWPFSLRRPWMKLDGLGITQQVQIPQFFEQIEVAFKRPASSVGRMGIATAENKDALRLR